MFYLCFKTLTIQTAWCVVVGEPQQGRLTLTFPRLAVFKGYFTCWPSSDMFISVSKRDEQQCSLMGIFWLFVFHEVTQTIQKKSVKHEIKLSDSKPLQASWLQALIKKFLFLMSVVFIHWERILVLPALRAQLSYQETYLVKTGAGMWIGRGRC